VTISLGTGGGSFAAPTRITVPNQAVALGDLDCDGKLDLHVGAFGTESLLWGNGNGTFSAPVTPPSAQSNVWKAVILDLDRDGRPDLLTASPAANGLKVRRGTCSRTLGAAVSLAVTPYAVAAADLDGDGWLDLVAVEHDVSSGGFVVVALSDGAGGYRAPVRYPVTLALQSPNYPNGLVIADFDGDGRPDVATAYLNGYTGRGYVATYRNLGGGVLGPQVDVEVRGGPADLAVGDLDGDGMPDLVISAGYLGSGTPGSETVTVLRNDGFGGFRRSDFFAGDYPSGVTVADLDGDGWDDVLVTLYNEGKIAVLPTRCLP
jgi:hypothetical protein